MPPLPVVSAEELWNTYTKTSTTSIFTLLPRTSSGQKDFEGLPDQPLQYWELNHNDAVGLPLKYTFEVNGTQPRDGSPLSIGLHGGDGCPVRVNSSQWIDMAKWHYGFDLESRVGPHVYVALRGLTSS